MNSFASRILFLGRDVGGRHAPVSDGFRAILRIAEEQTGCVLDLDGDACPGRVTKAVVTHNQDLSVRVGQQFLLSNGVRVIAVGVVEE